MREDATTSSRILWSVDSGFLIGMQSILNSEYLPTRKFFSKPLGGKTFMVNVNYTDSRSEWDWLINEVSRSVGSTSAFLKNARVGRWVRPTGYYVVRNINGRCYRYVEVILEGEGCFLVQQAVLGKAATQDCIIAEINLKFEYVDGHCVHTGSIRYE